MNDKINQMLNGSKSNGKLFNLAVITLVFAVMYVLFQFGILKGYYQTLAILVLISIIMASSLNVATGFLGQLVLGHAGFMAIGAYTASLIAILLTNSLPADYLDSNFNSLMIFIISALGAGVVASIAGVLVGTPALRLRGDYLGIMTLGFGEIVKVLFTNMKFNIGGEINGGAQGLKGIPRIMDFPTAYWTTVIIVAFIYLFMNSRHGRAILSIREDEIASESVGINITRYKILGFVVASMFGGIGGAVYAFQVGYLAPSAFGFIKSVDIFVIVVLGGMGSISGGIIASIFLVLLPEYLRSFEEYRLLIYSLLLILTMLFRPQGLMGTKEFSLFGIIKRAFKRQEIVLEDGDVDADS